MREIKFRAWSATTGEMWSWQDLLQQAYPTLSSISDKSDFAAVMQYTGKKDKHGSELYDRDLIKNGAGRVCRVDWFEPTGQWDATPIHCVHGDSSVGFKPEDWCWGVELIGNAYDNPELLEISK